MARRISSSLHKLFVDGRLLCVGKLTPDKELTDDKYGREYQSDDDVGMVEFGHNVSDCWTFYLKVVINLFAKESTE